MAIRNAWQPGLSCIKLCFHCTDRTRFRQCVPMTKTPPIFPLLNKGTVSCRRTHYFFVQDAVQLPCSVVLSTFSVFLHYMKQFRSGKMCSTQKTTHSYCNSHKRALLHTLLTLSTTFFLNSLLHFTICVPFLSFSAPSIFPFSSVPHLHFPNSPPFFGHLRDSF